MRDTIEVLMEAKVIVADGVFVQGDSTYTINGSVSVESKHIKYQMEWLLMKTQS
jgi:hypothetical protein